jgi:tetratricopeptide (TPR) repeat protein
MSENQGSHNGLGTFLHRMSAPILAVISLVSGVYGFVKLFADTDAGLVALIALTVGIGLLFGVCLYYARFWQPERQEQRPSGFAPLSEARRNAQAQTARQRKRLRRFAMAGLILIPIVSGAGVAGWCYVRSLPPKNIIVLVADFTGPEVETYGVTKTVEHHLREATKKYRDVEIQRLNKPIESSQGAQAEGKKRKAAIVLWGWYLIPGDVVPLSVHFEVLRPPKDLPQQLEQAARVSLQQAALAELKDFTLQPRLGNEMSYLSLFVLGMTRLAAGEWEEAIARFSDALGQTTAPSARLNPSVVYFHRGSAYLRTGDTERALADFTHAIQLQPTLAEAYANRVPIHVATGDYSQALADTTQAIHLQPDLAVAYNNRGLIYLHTHDYDRAIADFSATLQRLVEAKDASPAVRPDGRQLGTFDLGRDVPLVTFFFTALSKDIVYINRGTAYLLKDDLDRALADFTHAITRRPDRAVVYFNRAAVYFRKHDYDRALADLNKTIKLQPDFALAYTKRGVVYYHKGDTERALADISHAITLLPHADFYIIRAEVYAERDDHDRAIADWSQAITLQPDSSEAYRRRGDSYRLQGDAERALADLHQALHLAPDNAKVYYDRGWAYFDLQGDFERALADFDVALRIDPQSAKAFRARAYVRFYTGAFALAVDDLLQAQQLDPTPYTVLWLYLARQRGGLPAEDALQRDSATLTSPAWPAPILALYHSQMMPEAVLTAAADANPHKQQEQRCEAHFYVAQWYLLRNDRGRALPLLQAAASGCPKNFVEYAGAVAELRRLQERASRRACQAGCR